MIGHGYLKLTGFCFRSLRERHSLAAATVVAMIGAEFAHRVSPLSALRTATLVPDEAQACWACGAEYTACLHSDFAPPESTQAEQVMDLVVQRQAAQTKRGPGRPPKDKPAFTEKAAPPAPEPEVAPMVAPPVPTAGVEVAPGDPEAPVAPPGPVDPAPAVSAPPAAPVGADFGVRGVQTVSPLAPEVRAEAVPRVSAASIPAGDPMVVTSPYDVPPGRMDPADDPSCPDGVIVSDPSQIGASGAWMTAPGQMTALLTHDVIQVSWQDSTRDPLYRLIGRAGSPIPRPA